MDHRGELRAMLAADPTRSRVLVLVRSLRLPDCWVGAGFLRNAVWDRLHGRPASKPSGDVDVLWFDPERGDPWEDRILEARLMALDPSIAWSVKNQARMHLRNGDPPYASTLEAMRHWPETATAVAVRWTEQGGHEFAAPFGFEDLFGLVVRPTIGFRGEKRRVHLDRVRDKRWLATWPLLQVVDA